MEKLFSIESLLEDRVDDSLSIRVEDANMITEPNCIVDNYDFLSSIKQEETAIMACYYKVLAEAGEDQGAILESASETIDKIKKVIIKIIDNIIRVGKQICKNIANKINKLSIDKYYKKALEAFNNNSIEYVKFDKAYLFKNLDGSIPALPSVQALADTITKTVYSQDLGKNSTNSNDAEKANFDAQNGAMLLMGIMNKMIGITSSPITDTKELYAKIDTLFFDEKERKTIFAKKSDIDQYYTNIKNSSDEIEKMYQNISKFKKLLEIGMQKPERMHGANVANMFRNALRSAKMAHEFIKFVNIIYNKFVMAVVFRTNQEIAIIKKAASGLKDSNSNKEMDAETAESESVDAETLGFMAEAMDAKRRNALSDSQFGLPEDRKYPMPDAKHVRSAIKLFGHCEEDKKPQLAKRIMKFAKKYGVPVSKDSEVYKYAHQ